MKPTDYLFPAQVPAAIGARAIRLDHLHVNEVAWSRADAFAIVDALRDSHVAIVGGDVLVHSEVGYVHEHSNWCSEPTSTEEWRAFTARSHAETRSYLEAFPDPGGRRYAFVLVFGEGV